MTIYRVGGWTATIPDRDSSLFTLLRSQSAAKLLTSFLSQLLASVRRDHRVRFDAPLTPLQTLPESRRIRVRGQQDVTRCRAQEGEALLEILDRVWIFAT